MPKVRLDLLQQKSLIKLAVRLLRNYNLPEGLLLCAQLWTLSSIVGKEKFDKLLHHWPSKYPDKISNNLVVRTFLMCIFHVN